MKPMVKLIQTFLPVIIAFAMPSGIGGAFPLVAVELWVAAWVSRLVPRMAGNRL